MPLLPEAMIPFRIDQGRVLPGFLDARDLPWLSVLIEEIERFCGQPMRELRQRLREPLPCAMPYFKRCAATTVLLHLWRSEPDAPVPPDQARQALFCARAAHASRMEALTTAAAGLGVEPASLERSLFADLPGEKLLCAPEAIPSPHEVALRTNQLIVRSLLFHARRVRIKAEGALRSVVRQAKLRGLLCSVTQVNDPNYPGEPILDLSGPFMVFRHTLLYGRALGELVSFLPYCARFKLRADCMLRKGTAVLDVKTGDPIFPAEAPKPYDSKLEASFARDLRKAAPDWDLVREPQPVAAAGTLIFPDFLLRHRLQPERAFLVEIMGFWSPEYIARKLALLGEAKITNLILCLDETRACGEVELPASAHIVRFRQRINPLAVLAVAGEHPGRAP
jgi:predicted nuclease of restriction endonuclease-like RecB superfamily